eukprot:scaffold1033_cov171-Amphora_coffeaeformis.AAC.22
MAKSSRNDGWVKHRHIDTKYAARISHHSHQLLLAHSSKRKHTVDMWSLSLIIALAAVAAAIFVSNQEHSEEAFLLDWSDPPPWPVFIFFNVLSSALHSIADALVPPPIKMFDNAFAYQTSILAFVCQKYKIPDFLATGPKTVQEIAEYTKTTNVQNVERIMHALAADGMTKRTLC